MGGKEEKSATLTLPDGRTVKLPVLEGTVGPSLLDIRALYAKTGMFTYDPGFTATGSCSSKITYIDGAKGQLLHRGFSIEDLAEHGDFYDTSFLILFGELPDKKQREMHKEIITRHTMVHEKLIGFYRGFKSDAHPMAIMVGVVGALSAFYHDALDIDNPRHRLVAAYRLIAKMPTIAAIAYKTSIGQPIVYPRNDLTYSENFLHMLFATPCEPYKVNPVFAKAMDVIFILHADHEQNASTSTVRGAGSSKANPYACIASGISTLWGPAHGGANEACLRMLMEIGDVSQIPKYIAKAKDKSDPFRLMGFGHRVYKNYDPRATMMKKICHEVLAQTEKDPLFDVAMELERIALSDPYFKEKKLFPNVDFYSGIVLRAIGIPISMFTVLFAVSRTTGWVAQWLEMMQDPNFKIARPRQLYMGEPHRPFVSIDQRVEKVSFKSQL